MSTGSPPVLGDSFSHEPRRSPRLQDRGVAGREVTTTTADTGRSFGSVPSVPRGGLAFILYIQISNCIEKKSDG